MILFFGTDRSIRIARKTSSIFRWYVRSPQIEYVPGQLLGDRTGSLTDSTSLGILEQCAKHPEKVDARYVRKSGYPPPR